jgi:DNA-binding transcriptional LysR family regulator
LTASLVSVAEHLSFIAAANVIGTSPSTVSRKVSRLEDALGLRLFERTTRRVALRRGDCTTPNACRSSIISPTPIQ